jgi:glycosyltransferase involved in cell wall biosynthesis
LNVDSPETTPLRVAIVVQELDVRGGTHKQVQRLAKYLIERGHQCVVLTYFFDPARCFPGIEQLPVTVVPSSSRTPGMIRRLWQAIRLTRAISEEIQIINLHDSGLYPVAIVARFLRPKASVVWQINDLPSFFRTGVHKTKPAAGADAIKRVIFRWAVRSAKRVTVNVAKNRQRVAQQLGVDALTFHCGVDTPDGLRPPNAARREPIQIVSTGVLYPYRNYETLLQVQDRLQCDHGLASELSIVGATDLDPAYAGKVRSLIRRGGHRARLLGEVSEADLHRLYNRAHFFLFLNVDQSWGLAVFEAMSRGLPAVVSASVGATELLHEGVDALVVDPMDADAIARQIARVWGDPALWAQLSASGREAVKAMTWDSMYSSKVEALFKSLAKAA